jgi:hypothetical protein
MTKGFSPQVAGAPPRAAPAPLGKRLRPRIRITSGFVEFATISRTAKQVGDLGRAGRGSQPSVEITS